MKKLVKFQLEDQTMLLMEVEEIEADRAGDSTTERVALPGGQVMVEQAQQTFERALDSLQPATTAIIRKLKGINTPADEVQVKFGIKLSADAGAIFTTVGGEVNFEVTLKWSNGAKH